MDARVERSSGTSQATATSVRILVVMDARVEKGFRLKI